MARRQICDLHLPKVDVDVERHGHEAINTPTRGFPRRFVPNKFRLLDDRTIGCKNCEPRDTRACSDDEEAFAGAATNVAAGDGDGSDGCARRCDAIGLVALARDRNLLMLANGSWGRCPLGASCERGLQHARIEQHMNMNTFWSMRDELKPNSS